MSLKCMPLGVPWAILVRLCSFGSAGYRLRLGSCADNGPPLFMLNNPDCSLYSPRFAIKMRALSGLFVVRYSNTLLLGGMEAYTSDECLRARVMVHGESLMAYPNVATPTA
jgi:hypothetical protein